MTAIRSQDYICPIKFVLISLNLSLERYHANLPVKTGASRQKTDFLFLRLRKERKLKREGRCLKTEDWGRLGGTVG